MKAVVQRGARAQVLVVGERVGAIGPGMLVLLGVLRGDDALQARRLAERIARLRFFADEHGRMDRSALDLGLAALVVSQFTLAADGRKGRRPSFDLAAPPEVAEPLYEHFVAALRELGLPTSTGRFGARMDVELLNQGPVTFVLEEPCEPAPGATRPPEPRAEPPT
jgi:D-tyrosyl-tRNA(Tyr) deacylase